MWKKKRKRKRLRLKQDKEERQSSKNREKAKNKKYTTGEYEKDKYNNMVEMKLAGVLIKRVSKGGKNTGQKEAGEEIQEIILTSNMAYRIAKITGVIGRAGRRPNRHSGLFPGRLLTYVFESGICWHPTLDRG